MRIENGASCGGVIETNGVLTIQAAFCRVRATEAGFVAREVGPSTYL